MQITEERVKKLLNVFEKILREGKLTSALAGSVAGQLGFACTQRFGRLGRAKLRPFYRRQHDKVGVTALNNQLLQAITFWQFYLKRGPPREIPVNVSQLQTVVSYSDGEGSGGVGIAIFPPPPFAPRAGYIRVPESLREHWWRINGSTALRDTDIHYIEAVGPLLVLSNWPDLLKGRLWVHYIDNDSALASLVNGSSLVQASDLLTGATWERVADLKVFPWFERVQSASNPVDGLSRGDMEGPWILEEISFPRSVLRVFQQEAAR